MPSTAVTFSPGGRTDQYASICVGCQNFSPPRILDRRSELAHLDAVLARAPAKNPDDRYPTCLDFARALSQPGPRRDAAAPHPQSGLRTDRVAGAPRTQRLRLLLAHRTEWSTARSALTASHSIRVQRISRRSGRGRLGDRRLTRRCQRRAQPERGSNYVARYFAERK